MRGGSRSSLSGFSAPAPTPLHLPFKSPQLSPACQHHRNPHLLKPPLPGAVRSSPPSPRPPHLPPGLSAINPAIDHTETLKFVRQQAAWLRSTQAVGCTALGMQTCSSSMWLIFIIFPFFYSYLKQNFKNYCSGTS